MPASIMVWTSHRDGKFKDVAGPAIAEDMNFGMSASVGEYDRNSWMDIYFSNMFSGAGGRFTFQPGFQTDATDEIQAVSQRMAEGWRKKRRSRLRKNTRRFSTRWLSRRPLRGSSKRLFPRHNKPMHWRRPLVQLTWSKKSAGG